MGGAGAAGSSGTGTSGSSMTSDRVYRITLRMDDGSTQVVTQEATPDFRSGDRVNHSSGMIRR
jgi:outer membrane lipoprotein SlyB